MKKEIRWDLFLWVLFQECLAYIFRHIDNKAFKIFLFPCII